MRILASIQKIVDKQSIERADKLSQYTVLGWNCVAQKDDFDIGDFVVYIECDSIVPEWECFEFLRGKKFRIKTCRLRGVLSQGLLMPLTILPADQDIKIEEGVDVTDALQIKKYEPDPEFWTKLGGDIKAHFPGYLTKTDEIRVQSIVPNIFDEIDGKQLYVSVKCDGTSSTYFLHDGQFGVCSRNYEMSSTAENVYWFIAKKYDIESKLRKFHADYGIELAIQGEICGPGIQKNKLKLAEPQLFVFNMMKISDHEFMGYDGFVSTTKELDLPRVPCLTDVMIFDKGKHTLDYLLEMAKGKYDSGYDREGIVIRPIVECYSDVLKGRLSFKVLNNDFLEKE